MVLVKVEHEEAADTRLAALASGRLIFARDSENNLLWKSAKSLYALSAAYLATKVAVFWLCPNVHTANVAKIGVKVISDFISIFFKVYR
jgi:hypothetical protein